MVIVAIGTGIRRGDLFNLTWERIDFQRGLIDVPNLKIGRNYSVPVNEDVKAVLREKRYRAAATVTFSLTPIPPKPHTNIKTAFGTACQLAGIENLHWHNQHRSSTIGTARRIHIVEARDLNHVIQLLSQHPGGMKYELGPNEIRPLADLSEIIKESEQRRRKDTSR